MLFSSPNKERTKAKYRAEQSRAESVFDDPMMMRKSRNPETHSGGDSPSLNSRTKTTRKRPKYLSLRSQLSNPDTDPSPRLRPLRHYYTRRKSRRLLQPLKTPQPPMHRPSLPLENSLALDDNVALLFTSSDDATATLKGLLVDCEDEEEARRTAVGTSGEESVSRRCTYGGSGSPLIRSAMKSGYSNHHEGGEDHEEKWVHYSEVVEKKEEEVSSNYCTATAAGAGGMFCLSLKLDYQEVVDAWSDKGSLFIRHGIGMDESPQIVPDLCAEFDGLSSGISDWLANVANLWRVPEKGETGNMDCEDKEGRMRIREASVLRYKEKRHNRLFAKRIRYEVRKLNAEKRPRIKGRFVRRNGED